MDYKGATFINDVIKKVLKLPLTQERYAEIAKNLGIKLESGRNVFSNCLVGNPKYIKEDYLDILKVVMMEETQNKSQKNKLIEYFKKYLTKDVLQLIEKEPDNIEKIIDLAISKFSHDGNKDNPKEKVDETLKEITELYIGAIKYLRDDEYKKAYQLYKIMINKIIEQIIENEKLEFIKKSKNKHTKVQLKSIEYKKVVPQSILFLIEQMQSIIKIKDSSTLIELVFLNNQQILKWFIEEYLKKDTYFSVIENKANEMFYENTDKIIVHSVKSLKRLGWTIEEIANKTTELFNANVPQREDNITDPTSKIEKMRYEPDSRRILMNQDEEIVGYWVFVPLFDDTYEKVKEGTLKNTEINQSHIRLIMPGGTYNIEFGAVYLAEDYRNYTGYKTLIYSIVDHIEKLALDGIFINEICTKSSNRDGTGFITSMGLKIYKQHPDNEKISIFSGTIIDLLEKDYLKKYSYLKSLYNKHFENII